MTENLRSCPFCGSSNVEVSEDDRGVARWVTCSDCDCDGPQVDYRLIGTKEQFRKEVIDKWNTREDR